MNFKDGEWKQKMRDWGVLAISSGGGAGYFPVAPGTMGSVVGVLIVWIFRDTPLFFMCALTLFLMGVGVWAGHEAGKLYKEADCGKIVIDEIVGVMVTMIGIPISGYWLGFGFVLFRVFDVTKPPPANFFDRKMKNGWGVMMDDVVAGIYSNILLHLILRATI